MGAGWQISLGDMAEMLRPAWFALTALVSAWVLRDSLRRASFQRYEVAAWTLSALILPFVVLPLYLALRLFKPDGSPSVAERPLADRDDRTQLDPLAVSDRGDATSAGESCGSACERASEGSETIEEDASLDTSGLDVNPDVDVNADLKRDPRPRLKAALPLIYLVFLLAAVAIFFYNDGRSFDARIAQAKRAKLDGQPGRVIRFYRAALATREDAHTRKLLGLELLDAGRAGEALTEFRAARRDATDEDRLSFHEASALYALGRRDEAAALYREFLLTGSCAGRRADELCDFARARVGASPP